MWWLAFIEFAGILLFLVVGELHHYRRGNDVYDWTRWLAKRLGVKRGIK